MERWRSRMLASGDAKRWQLASIATLVSHAPSVRLLPLLNRRRLAPPYICQDDSGKLLAVVPILEIAAGVFLGVVAL